MFTILPFEKDFYEKKHHFPVHFVGHPLLDDPEIGAQTPPLEGREHRVRVGRHHDGQRERPDLSEDPGLPDHYGFCRYAIFLLDHQFSGSANV